MEEENWDEVNVASGVQNKEPNATNSKTYNNMNTGYNDWDLTKTNGQTYSNVNTGYNDWDLTNKSNGQTYNNYTNTDYDKGNQTLTTGHSYNNGNINTEEDWSLAETNVTSNYYQNNGQAKDSYVNAEPVDEWGDTITGHSYNNSNINTEEDWSLAETNVTSNYYQNNGQAKDSYINAEPVDEWGDTITSNRKLNDYSSGHVSYYNEPQESLNNEIETNSYQSKGYKNNGRFKHTKDQGKNNSYPQKSTGYETNNANKELEKSKPTYIPPEFEENDILTIEAGSNFEKYDKIEVTVSGIDVPKNITTFKNSGIREILLNNLTKCHYTIPTPIQKYALPIIMAGRDMIASAQTGSGKTAAFLLPILNGLISDECQLIVDQNHCEPQVLIMSPTRELAIQICEFATRLSKDTGIKSELLYGGTSTYYQKQRILGGVNIIVATPGRLLDFVNRGLITFSSLKYFVLDEADRMLDMGFELEVERVLNHETMVSSAERTTAMFSATLPDSVQQIAKSYLKPHYISVAVGEIGGACKDVTQTFMEVKKFDKKKQLLTLLKESEDCQGTIVFVEQKRQADFIAVFLSEFDYPTTSIHGDREQPERERALKDFKTKKMKILVATSVAARGLDIMGVTMVVNFDLPKTVEEYVHRIGRTGRLGNFGKAVSFYDPETDHHIASSLVNTLKLADQEVPEFLLRFENEGNYTSGDSNQFNDIRTDVTVHSEYVSDMYSLEEAW